MGVEIKTVKMITCKHCDSEAVVKYGSYKGVPRYLCKVCRRKFKADDNLSGMRIPTSEISSALNLYYDGSSVRAIGRHFNQGNGHTPSTATIYEWIQKYSQYLTDSTKDYHPQDIGSEWVADETVLKIGGSQLWLWDIIDTKTRMLLASRLSRSRTTRDAQILIDKAIKMAGKEPETVLTDQLPSYLDVFYGKDAEHKHGSPFSKVEGESTSKIERWHGTLKSRTKVMRGLKNFETALDFTEAYQAYYNYLRSHESLEGKTPAEVAGVSYPYKNWDDVIRNYKPKNKIVIEHQQRDILRLPKQHIGRPHKIRKPKDSGIHLGGGVYQERSGRRHIRIEGVYTDKSSSMLSRRPRGRGWRRLY
jgi:putative transposase